jgi:hypothetical protein
MEARAGCGNICSARLDRYQRISVSARLDIDARNAELDARRSIPMVVALVVPLAVDPLVNDLVAVALIEAPRSADIVAANLTTNLGDRLRDAQLFRRTLQAGRWPGRSLSQRCARQSDGRNRQQKK